MAKWHLLICSGQTSTANEITGGNAWMTALVSIPYDDTDTAIRAQNKINEQWSRLGALTLLIPGEPETKPNEY